jgi:uncharacterized membrane protein
MEPVLLLGFLLTLLFLIGVPWAAFTALSRVGEIAKRIPSLEREIRDLQQELDTLQRAWAAPVAGTSPVQSDAPVTEPQPAVDAPDEPTETDAADKLVADNPELALVRQELDNKIFGSRVAVESIPTGAALSEPASVAPSITTSVAKSDAPSVGQWTSRTNDRDTNAASDSSPVTPPPPRRDIEELLGTRWTVWVGALALGLGGLFLLRYSIEAGFFGPRVRIGLAALFALSLLSLGEAARRGAVNRQRLSALPAEHVPLAITAAGCAVAFGTVYAAHTIYGFVGQTTAFGLLALVALGTMGAALVHGQALAGVGLLGAYATPVLVGGEARTLWPLVVYLSTVGAAALALNRRFRADWLSYGVLAGVVGWTLLLVLSQRPDAEPLLFYVTTALIMFLAATSWTIAVTEPESSLGDNLPWVCLTALAMLLGLAFLRPDIPIGPVAIAALLAVLLLALTAIRDPRVTFGLPLALVLALGVTLTWPAILSDIPWFQRVIEGWRLAPSAAPRASTILFAFATLSATFIFLAPVLRAMGRPPALLLHQPIARLVIGFAGGMGTPLLALATAIRFGGLAQDLRVAALFLFLTVLCAAVALLLLRRSELHATEGQDSAGYFAGAALALGLAIAFALPGFWMAVGFSIAAALIAWLVAARPMPGLRNVAGAFASAALLRAALSPELLDNAARPVLNAYLPAYGLPFVALAAGAIWMRRVAQDRPSRIFEFTAITFAAALVGLQLRHAFHGSDLFAYPAFHESWLLAIAAVPFVAAGVALHDRKEAWPGLYALAIGTVMVLAGAGLGLLALRNPFFDGSYVAGWPILNRLTAGHLAGLLAAWLCGSIIGDRSRKAATTLHVVAGALSLLLMVSQIRFFYHGGELIDEWRLGLAEAGTYVLSAIGAAALVLAVRGDETPKLDFAWTIANTTALALAFAFCLYVANPLVGAHLATLGPFDSSLIGFLATALGFAGLVWLSDRSPAAQVHMLFVANRWTAIGLGYLFLLVQIRRAFVGAESMSWAVISDGEHYALSVVTLLYGVLLLALGLKLASRELRLASAVVVMAAVAKVFIYDMAGLSGLWRPVSFIGLGAVLIGIGMVYQRLLFRKPEPVDELRPI